MLTYENIKDIYALTPMQEGMYFHALYDEASLAYFEQLSYRFCHPLHIEVVEKSIRTLFERHDVLRTVFNHAKHDVPLQVVLKEVPFRLYYKDLRAHEKPLAYLQKFKEQDKKRPFNLNKEVLMRVALFRLQEEEYEFIWTHHHILMDGWCVNILIHEFTEIYQSFIENRPHRLPYIQPFRTYIEWLEQQDNEQAKQYWQHYLHHFQGMTSIPKKNLVIEEKNENYKRQERVFKIDEGLTNALKQRVTSRQTTLNMVFQTIWGILLSKYNLQKDVVFGTVISGRSPEIEGIDTMVGLFINTIPVRVQYTPSTTFETLLKHLHEASIESQKYAYFPLAEIQQLSGLPQQLFDHLYGFQQFAQSPSSKNNTTVRNVENYEQTNYDFNIKIIPGDAVTVVYEYNALAIDALVIEGLVTQFQEIVQQIIADPQILVETIQLTVPKAQQDFINSLNNTRRRYPRGKSVVGIFEEMVQKYPDQLAVQDHDKAWSYQELNVASNRIAQFLIHQNILTGSVIGLYMQKSAEMIAAMLGILKTGAAYLPVNTEYPVDRIKYMLEDAHASLLISEAKFIKEINQLQWECKGIRAILCMDSDDVLKEIEPIGELMNAELWEYFGKNAADDIEGGGWIDSFTGEKFSRQIMDEYGNNILQKLLPYVDKSKKVLEIGCASGISMFRMAPHVGEYVGTDHSQVIIEYDRKICEAQGVDNIRLECMAADDIHQLGNQSFDVIILNSVVQCFNGFNHLREIIRKCTELLNETGIIFLGDIMDLELKQDMIEALLTHKIRTGNTKTKTDFSNELLVPKAFFEDLVHEVPEIDEVKISEKIFTLSCELTDYRFDVILQINKKGKDKKRPQKQYKYQFGRPAWKKYDFAPLPISIDAGQIANIIFTSGSTGKPKGILIPHRALVRLVKNTNYMKVSPDHVWAQTVDISFDPSTLEIFGALLNGASLILVKKEELLEAPALAHILQEHRISHLVLITPIFHEMASIKPEMFAHIDTLIIGGEAISAKHVRRVKAFCPDIRIINAYGPTENTVISTTYEANGEETMMPIGKPIANAEAYILGRQAELLPIGIPGELCVAGDGLALGYLNNVSLTQSQFIHHPFKPGEKLYKTGDYAQWNTDGNIIFLGRKDDQVKIRGYRIEPGEIEEAIKGLPLVDHAIVLVITDHQEKALCAYIKLKEDIEEDALKALLMMRLPSYMVPAYFVKISKFPLTANGKLDRKALPYPDAIVRGSKQHYEAPRNEIEEKLVQIWEMVLGKKGIGIHDNFFEIGGHSLKATQVVSRIWKAFKVQVKLATFFDSPVIQALAKEIGGRVKEQFQEIVPVTTKEFYDVSHAQKRLWILNEYDEGNVAYNIAGAYLLQHLDPAVFEDCLYALVQRHESLRTTFVKVKGEPKQRIRDIESCGFTVERIDLRGQEQPELAAETLAHQEAYTPFDLENGPLVRAKLLQLADEKHLFCFTMHHIIADGWSMKILLDEMNALYQAFIKGEPNPLPPLSIQYKDFVHWQNSMTLEGEEKYWLNKLSGEVHWVALPYDQSNPGYRCFKGSEESEVLETDVVQKLNNIAIHHNTSLSNVIFTIFNILLYNISGQKDILTGIAIANRNHADIENLIGFFVNTLVIRTQITDDIEFEDLLKQVSQNMLEAFDHQNYPFDLLVEKLNPERIANEQPIFNVLYGFQNYANVAVNQPAERTAASLTQAEQLQVELFRQNLNTSKFDLTLFVYNREDQALQLVFEYNSELFYQATIQKWLRYFTKFAKSIIAEVK